MLILIKSSIPSVRRSEFESNSEIIWIQLSTSDGPLLFGVFYRPPNSGISTLNNRVEFSYIIYPW